MSKQKHKMSVNKNKQLQIQKKDIEIFTDAFNLCWDLLKKNNYYNTENVDNKKSQISTLSVINGQKIYDAMINIIEDITKTNNGAFDYSEKSILNIDSAKKPDYIEHQKINYGVWEQPDGWSSQLLQSASSRIIEPLDDSSTSRYNNYQHNHHHHHHHHNYTDSVYTGLTNINVGNSSMEKDYDDDDTDDDYGKIINKKNTSRNQPIVFVPHELKLRAVTISRDNPTWSVKKIREESGCNHIVSKQQIERWGEQLERGGSARDKWKDINNWVYERCLENKSRNIKVTNKLIQNWGLEAKTILMIPSLKFSATSGWLAYFKKRFNITGKAWDLNIDNEPLLPSPASMVVANFDTHNLPWELGGKINEKIKNHRKNYKKLRVE